MYQQISNDAGLKKNKVMKQYLVLINQTEKVIVIAPTAEDARQKAKKENNAWGATIIKRIKSKF